jgi:hypothetical protein
MPIPDMKIEQELPTAQSKVESDDWIAEPLDSKLSSI